MAAGTEGFGGVGNPRSKNSRTARRRWSACRMMGRKSVQQQVFRHRGALLLALVAVALVLACVPWGVRAGSVKRPPKLVVVLTIDQFRKDFLDRYASFLSPGASRA